MTDFASELLEIIHDVVTLEGTDPTHPSFARMEDALDISTTQALLALEDAVTTEAAKMAEILEDTPASPTVLAAVFTWGVLAGREHARRGYAL